MDLIPVKPSDLAPRYPESHHCKGEVIPGRYNWSGWSFVCKKFQDWGVDISTFSGCNDGERIPKKVCIAVADAIDAHKDELIKDNCQWLIEDSILWRTCGGYRQY